MGRLREPTAGTALRSYPSSFPEYFTTRRARVITADPWAFIRNTVASKVAASTRAKATSFVDQALEFYEAAGNPGLAARPLLYYYSFLNLAKAYMLVRSVPLPVRIKHGLSDPGVNARKRLKLEGQRLLMSKAATDHSELFPEFVAGLGGSIARPRQVPILTLLRQIPGVHRTFCSVTAEAPSFLPIKRFEFRRNGTEIHGRLILSRPDSDVRGTLPKCRSRRAFGRVFTQVSSGTNSDEIVFETSAREGVKRGTDTALRWLAEQVRSVGIWPVLTRDGHRYYLSTMPPRDRLPALASIYAVMFYLGSITRYKPYDFDKIFSGKFSWLICEFLRTQPAQFLYGIAGYTAGVDVVLPFALLE